MTVRDRARATRFQGVADIIVRQHNGVRQRQNKGSLIVEGMCFPRRLSLGRIAQIPAVDLLTTAPRREDRKYQTNASGPKHFRFVNAAKNSRG